jgi:hypothetical protein
VRPTGVVVAGATQTAERRETKNDRRAVGSWRLGQFEIGTISALVIAICNSRATPRRLRLMMMMMAAATAATTTRWGLRPGGEVVAH